MAETTKRHGKGAQLAGGVVVALGALASADASASTAITGTSASVQPATAGMGGLELCQNSTTGISYGAMGLGAKPLDCAPGGGRVSFSLNNASNDNGGFGFAVSSARVTGYSNGILELHGAGGISMLDDVYMNGKGITGLRPGQVSATSTDAVNGSQLNTVVGAVNNNIANINYLNDSVNINSTNIENIALGKAGVVRQADFNSDITVGAGTGGKNVNFANSAGAPRGLTGVAQGALSATSTDAVNGAQAYAIQSAVQSNATAITNIDSRMSLSEENYLSIKLGTDGMVQQSGPGADLTVGAKTDGAAVNFKNVNGVARRLSGVAAGDVSVNSSEAVNGAQLYTTNQNVDGLGTRVTTTENNVTNINNTLNQISSSATLVQQSAPGANLTVGAKTDGAAVDFTSVSGTGRRLTGLAAGELSATSADAVTGAQLNSTNLNVAQNSSNITTLNGRVSVNETNIASLDGRMGSAETNITSLNQTIQNFDVGGVGLVKQSGPGQNITVAAGTDGVAVDFANKAGTARTLIGVNAGNLSATSTEAINGSQLYATNQNVSINTANIDQNRQTIGSLDGRVTGNTTNITNLDGRVTGNTTNITNLDGRVTGNTTNITNLDGRVTGNTTNITNLDGRVTGNTTNITNLDGRVTTNTTNIANLDQSVTNLNQTVKNVASGKDGMVQQSGPGADLTVGAKTDGAAVNFRNVNGVARRLSGVAAGDVSVNSSDAVNGAQLYATNQNVDGLGTRVTTTENNVTNINNTLNQISSSATLVQQSAPGANLTVGAKTDGAAVDFTSVSGTGRRLTGLAAGELSATSADAVTGAQLNSTNLNVAQNSSNITTLNGRVSVNETNIAGLDGRMGSAETNITNLNQTIQNFDVGGVGLVKQSGPGQNITVAAGTDGAAVDFTNKAGAARTLIGVNAGNLSATSTEAVNGSQLYATNQNVSINTANIDQNRQTIGSLDGRVTTNETNITAINNTINGMDVNGVGLVKQAAPGANLTVGAATDGAAVDFTNNAAATRTLTGVSSGTLSERSTEAVNGAQLYASNQNIAQNTSAIQGLDGRVTTNTTEIGNLSNALGGLQSGTSGIVTQAGPSAPILVGGTSGGSVVDFTGTDGVRRLSGVANGQTDNDAVNMAQLNQVSATVNAMTGNLGGVVTYDGADFSGVTLKGQNGTVIHNVAAGNVASGSMDAINGSQLFGLQQEFAQLSSQILTPADIYAMLPAPGSGGTVSPLSWSGTGVASTAVGTGAQASGTNTTAVGYSAHATGRNATALGQASTASGDGSTALGQGAAATGANSVALGAGSIAERDNTVSVGAQGMARQITNVAAGTAPTDAVNVQQMNSSTEKMRRDAFSGVATAMAVAGLPQSDEAGRTMVAVGGGTYASQFGAAVGVSYRTRNGSWIVKASAAAGDRGDFGGSVAAGYYW